MLNETNGSSLPVFALTMLASLMTSVQLCAADYPVRPVRIIVALSAGSQIDLLARILAPNLSEAWRQSVVVENRPGGAGGIAGGMLAKAEADGHTLMMYSDGHAINAALSPE